MNRLEGKTALVTGSSRSIGRAIAMGFAAEGALVAVHGRTPESTKDTVADVAAAGGRAVSVHGDLAELAGVRSMFASLDAALPGRGDGHALDILVNNAGIAPRATIEDCNPELFDQIFAINARAPFFVIQEALKRIRDGGRIINVSTSGTRSALPEYAAYTASKGALNVLTLVLAQQLGPRGITVNSIAPGVIDTDMNAGWLNGASAAAVAGQTALGRIGHADDVVGVAAFLASADGAWVTAQIIEASGGLRL